MKLYRNTYADDRGPIGAAHFRTAKLAQDDWLATSDKLRNRQARMAEFIEVPTHKDEMIAFLDQLAGAPDPKSRRA